MNEAEIIIAELRTLQANARTTRQFSPDELVANSYALAWRLGRHRIAHASIVESLINGGCPPALAPEIVSRANRDRTRATRRAAALLFGQAVLSLTIGGSIALWVMGKSFELGGVGFIVLLGSVVYTLVYLVRAVRGLITGSDLDTGAASNIAANKCMSADAGR